MSTSCADPIVIDRDGKLVQLRPRPDGRGVRVFVDGCFRAVANCCNEESFEALVAKLSITEQPGEDPLWGHLRL